ncbi:MAG: alpha/beta fold hydrolase [Gemmatimonadetes bacterium]|nr:alpha/beta fold hydrolase [Gemmatimonadota bacterium]
MHRWSIAILLTGTVAAPAFAQVRTGGFVAHQDGKEIARERYRFDGSTLEADVEVTGRGIRLTTRTEYNPALSPTRFRAAVFGGGGRSAIQEMDAAFSDSVRWTARTAGAASADSAFVMRPYATMQNRLFSHLAAILLRYSRPAGGVQVLDVWFPDGGRVGQLRMSFKGDTGTVDVGGVSMRVTTDRDGWLRSVSVPAQRLSVEWRADVAFAASETLAADTAPPVKARESPLAILSAGARLAGTLTVPPSATGRIPLAVIGAGSGGVDRNGNAAPVLRTNTYAQLAWKLAERGIASIRYDKRWVGESRGGARPDSLTFDDFAGDVVAAVSAALGDTRFGPVVVIGHSEGGLLALRAAARGVFPVAGIALLATPGRRFADVVTDQLRRQVDSVAARRFAELFPRYVAGEDLVNVPEYLRPLLLPVNRRFAASVAAFDPLAAARAARGALLIVQGGADIQVSLADAQLFRGVRPDAQLAIIPQANHVYKAAAGTGRMAQLALYQDPTVPIVPELVATLGTWIDGLVRP